jgi:hypothetical protein
MTFAMADGTALKLAKTNAGIAQNKQEAKVCMNPDKRYAIFPDFFGADQVNWLALSCELCAAANAQDFKQIFKCQPSALVNIIEFIIKMRIESFQMNMLVEYYTNMNNVVYANAVKNIINNY